MKKRIILITVICILIDQLSKFLVISNLDVNMGKTIIPSFFSILYIKNTGAAWGMFSNGTMILSILSIIFLILLIKYIIDSKSISRLGSYTYGMLIGGIIGNLIDRLVRQYVVDFLSFRIFSYHYPVFNLADVFIVVSVILIALETFFSSKKKVSVSDSN